MGDSVLDLIGESDTESRNKEFRRDVGVEGDGICRPT